MLKKFYVNNGHVIVYNNSEISLFSLVNLNREGSIKINEDN